MTSRIRLAIFFLELPEPLALPNGSTFTFQTDESFPELDGLEEIRPTAELPPVPLPDKDSGNVVASFRIWQVDASELTERPYLEATNHAIARVVPARIAPRSDAKNAPRLHPYRTVVEAVTPVRFNSSPGEMSAAFDRCERYLWKLVDAYRTMAPRLIARPTRELLPPIVPFITRDAEAPGEWDDTLSLFHLNFNVPHGEPPFGPDEMAKFEIIVSHTMVEHPFVAYSLRSKEASAALGQRGDTADSIIRAQMAAEVLLDTVLMSMLWEEGSDPIAAANVVFQQGLVTRVRTHYAPRLGGNWSTRGRNPVAEWSRNIAALRGRVVHGNYTPTRDESRSALAALDELDGFVRKRLAARKSKYKRTALMLLGRPGLERLGAWSGEIVRFVEEDAGKEPDWRLSFREWRERSNQAR